MKRVYLLIVSLMLSGCAHTRHTAVVIDAAFAQSVFALDDAQTQACRQHILTAEQCAASDPKVKQALKDVEAVTLALQATPKDAAVPASLPDLMADISAIQAIVGPIESIGGPAGNVASKAQSAMNQALALLKLYTQASGGQ